MAPARHISIGRVDVSGRGLRRRSVVRVGATPCEAPATRLFHLIRCAHRSKLWSVNYWECVGAMARSRRTVDVAALVSFVAWCSISAATAADANNGKRLAERWCVSCHIVGPNQQSATTQAPPFSEIAKQTRSSSTLAYFLLDPHPKMPDVGLSRSAADDIAAYIATQR